MTFTFSPEQVFVYAGLIMFLLGALMMICFFIGLVGERVFFRWTALALLMIGGLSALSGFVTRNDRIFAEKLATFPIEWQEFQANLGELGYSLRREAIKRFAASQPSQITPEQYHILVAGPIFPAGTGKLGRVYNDDHIRVHVTMPFAEGKQQ